MLKNATTENKLLLFGYGAIAVAYTILFVIKLKHTTHK
jgi:hypothetical protein